MKTIEEIRRIRLQMLVDEAGSQAALNRLTGRGDRDSTYSQILRQSKSSSTAKRKVMGSDMARMLEQAVGKPVGWMDNDPAMDQLPSWPFDELDEAKVRALSRTELIRLETMIVLKAIDLGLNIRKSPSDAHAGSETARKDPSAVTPPRLKVGS